MMRVCELVISRVYYLLYCCFCVCVEDGEDDESNAPHHYGGGVTNRPSSMRSNRKRGSSGATSEGGAAGGVITRLRNSSINSAQSEAVDSNYGDQPEYARTSTNFGSHKGGAASKQGTPVHSHRPRMGVFTK